jgi:hypothetical protein
MSNTLSYLYTKDPTEIIPLTWQITDAGITAVEPVTVTVSVISGIDSSPSAMLFGAHTLTGGNTITQAIQGGIDGVTYKVKLTATLSDGTKYVHSAVLPVAVL